jgi:hypothetical protein
MWGFWAGSHWRGSNAAIVNLDWTLNEAGRRYQALLTEWTTRTNGATDPTGVLAFRGFHGAYDVTVTLPGKQPTLRRIALDPGIGTSTNVLIVNPTDPSRPVLHSINYLPTSSQFSFQLSGDAGRTNQLQVSTTLTNPISNWTPLSNIYNASGTVGFTNPAPATQPQLFFRARVLP